MLTGFYLLLAGIRDSIEDFANMSATKYLRDTAVFAPCYVLLDWASYFDPIGPFDITPWSPSAALAIAWMLLAGLRYAPAVFFSIIVSETVVRHAPGGYLVALLCAAILASGYAGIARALRIVLAEAGAPRTTRQLTLFAGVVVAGTAVVGAAFVGALELAGLIPGISFLDAWSRFWIGDAVGVLVMGPLLLAVADAERRAALRALARRAEPWLQAAVLVATLWLIFEGIGGDPSRHFYFLFVPLIWIAARHGLHGALLAAAIVQIGVVLGVRGSPPNLLPVVELQALVAALTLTGLYLGVMVDERARAVEGLRDSLRLAAAGEMAGAIAHELNQPLTAVVNYGHSAQALLARGAQQAQINEVIGRLLAEAQRAAEVVRRLRDLFRAGTTHLELVAAGEIAAAARRIGEQVIGPRPIALEVSAEPAVPPLYIDRLQIEIVLRNLIANAVEALAERAEPGARIEVSVQGQGNAEHVRIVVADNGPGLRAGARSRLFRPFASDRPRGMGLGLAVSRAIAEAHGGTLQARAVGHGEFHLLLPCAAKS
jgi:signal transduction histidine kinase